MDKKTLLIFAKRILSGSSREKAAVSLRQLQLLLEEQGAPSDHIGLLEEMLQSIPEMQKASSGAILTEADVHIAHRRARERILREEAAKNYGRC